MAIICCPSLKTIMDLGATVNDASDCFYAVKYDGYEVFSQWLNDYVLKDSEEKAVCLSRLHFETYRLRDFDKINGELFTPLSRSVLTNAIYRTNFFVKVQKIKLYDVHIKAVLEPIGQGTS